MIPTYNRDCTKLVRELQMQAEKVKGLHYEVLVADDASTHLDIKRSNRTIGNLGKCSLIELEQNIGRARIRNFLAQRAEYPYLLFLDSDVQIVSDDFLKKYLCLEECLVAYGGVGILPDAELAAHNLRYRYEVSCEAQFSVENRKKKPYHGFRTSNFLVRRDVLLRHPFDEKIRRYGYEDVLFGIQLQSANIPVTHIENPVAVDDFEPNEEFLRKTDEGLQTLLSIESEMRGYSNLLKCVDNLQRWHLAPLAGFVYSVFSKIIKRNLLGQHPNVKLYNVYRLCTYLRLRGRNEKNKFRI